MGVKKPGSDIAGLKLLFPTQERPDRGTVKDVIGRLDHVSISHDPAFPARLALVGEETGIPRPIDQGIVGFELLFEGLTFELTGLAPGAPNDISPVKHQFDHEGSIDHLSYAALLLTPGRHLSGGARSLPVMRAMAELCCLLIRAFDTLEAVVWEPSKSAMGRRYFESVISAWVEGGPFPAIGLTAFEQTSDGAIESVGLSFWTGQELRIETSVGLEPIESTRLAVRLIDQLVQMKPVDRVQRFLGADGQSLALHPSRDNRLLHVEPD